jgi:A/G-specific adenine glycosylase
LNWFDASKRNLPWRGQRDPYRIWVSEVMLQQTQVATVIPYYHRFVKRFPTVNSLAAAELQEVLRYWEGLGYYRRATNLHKSARIIVADHNGRFPSDEASWFDLPGIGRYMKGAILSQAFGRRLPIVEANSQRVLSRLFGFGEDPKSNSSKNRLWQFAESLVPEIRPGDFNQALMELGAIVCKPKNPRCEFCPIAKQCIANLEGRTADIPPPKRPVLLTDLEAIVTVVLKGRRALIAQRPANVRWAHLWEFPQTEILPNESIEEAAHRTIRELADLRIRDVTPSAAIRHSVTRYRLRLNCVTAKHVAGSFRSDFYVRWQWIELDQLHAVPISAAQRKLVNILLEKGRIRNSGETSCRKA